MASGQLLRAEALACTGHRHACHVMLYSDTKSQLFGRIPIRHVVLMQVRFDGLLGFPGGLVDPSKETLEAGLTRELLEELGVAVPVSEEDHVESRLAPAVSAAPSNLITHFYVKKMEEEQIREVEKASASTAVDHGLEVMGMVRVPLFSTKRGGGLGFFLSHSFIGNARSQLINSLLRLHLLSAPELQCALRSSLKMHAQSAEDLKAALALC
ncbi:U8 snoRNA-decapping enzyme [Kryptolebias marmoratus]|uniref:U8 snoRNA-decapping enzyme n=1 Tax=Kryptolebias marmoratus TaxID=37003 RepID=A0A3Q3A3M5_KRYMA|nr:U8 snoRNA-decapping enzyme [Kryptolebias marmoratus]XP_017266715.1 U8 snoRNA-decapping enzyme [Kryptolebias marmoratus]XP_017266716.1 U8 snoRNA-decapping enzyme [Kryptolebias marmoratus]XP_037832969.1 U8 snoRNA-decapping enzyme [Kryptolebias marmoratus]